MYLSTNSKADGAIYLTFEDAGKMSGKAFGLIEYDLHKRQFGVTTRLKTDKQFFHTLKAAEYFALAMAEEFLELERLCRDIQD